MSLLGRNCFGEAMPEHLSEEQIARYRERRIPPEQLLQVDDHISVCAVCRERLASANELRAALQGADTRPLPGQRGDARPALLGAASQGAYLQDMGAASPPGAPPAGHLAYEQLEAYVDGKMSDTDLGIARGHLEFCPSCSDEVRDLNTFKVELANSKSHSREGWWAAFVAMWLTRRRIAFAVAMAAVIAMAAELGIRRMAPPHSVPSSGKANFASPETLWAIKTLSAKEQAAVLEVLSQQKIKPPDVLAGLRGTGETLLGGSPKGARFEVLEPLGEVVLDVRPLFRWRPLAGAISYSVAIFDPNLNPVQSSPALGITQWLADQPLPRGQTYLWQVTAKLGNGQTVSSPRPPSSEARFRVLDQERADELSLFQAIHPGAHLALGVLYAEAGLLKQGEQKLGQLPKSDPDYDLAQRLLKSIQEIRSPTGRKATFAVPKASLEIRSIY
jgi:anti-sigma factor RsiW